MNPKEWSKERLFITTILLLCIIGWIGGAVVYYIIVWASTYDWHNPLLQAQSLGVFVVGFIGGIFAAIFIFGEVPQE
jgi:hypothetical protein